MSDEIRVLGQICKALCTLQNATWTRKQKMWENDLKINNEAYSTYTELIKYFFPLSEEEAEAFFLDSKSVNFNLSEERKAIYLSPISNQPRFVPVISLECDLNDAISNIKIRTMLIQKRNNVLKGIGFRFEKGDNTHNYHHVQLIQELQGVKHTSNPIVERLDWLPESEPAIPIKADNPITLLLCSLISIYGLRTCYKLITEYHISELKHYLEFFVESNENAKSRKKK